MDIRILCRICAAGKPGNSRAGSREPDREGECWLAGCGELGAGSRELGQGLGAGEQVAGVRGLGLGVGTPGGMRLLMSGYTSRRAGSKGTTVFADVWDFWQRGCWWKNVKCGTVVSEYR